MSFVKHALVLATGAAFGVAAVLSCSDDSPRHSDAATCDCPASEPPLAGRLLFQDSIRTMGPAGGPENGEGFAAIACPPGSVFLTGSCTNTTNNFVDVTLRESGFVLNQQNPGWQCNFHNNSSSPVQIKATVVCLMPAS
jgi:hypothetical protein